MVREHFHDLLSLVIFTEARNEDKAKLVAGRVLNQLGPAKIISVQEYEKVDGHRVTMEVERPASNWPDAILDTLQIAQAIGYGWYLTGDINSEVDMTTSKAKESGITMIQIVRIKK